MFPIFEPIGNSAHTTKCLALGKALLIVLTFYLQMLEILISNQRDNHI